MSLITQAEYAKQRGVSRPYICRLVKEGKIRLVEGKVDPEAANADLAKSSLKAPRVLPRADQQPKAEPQHRSPERMENPGTVSYIQARTVHETYKAKKEKLEYEKLAGKLVEADRMMEAGEKAFSNVRVRLRGLAKSLAPILAANHHPPEIERMLIDAIDGALEGLGSDVFRP